MKKQNYRKFLRNVYFFQSLTDEQINKIADVCGQEKFAAGDIVFLEGSRAEKFYIVSGGAVELWKGYGEPHRDLLATHRKGGIFGEMALVDDLPRSATVVASRQTTLLYVKREDFQRIIQEDSFIALSIMKGLSSIVRKSNEAFMGSLRERNRRLELANSELKRTQEELLRAERLSTLGKFSSLILHDIRNPLTILRIHAELIVANRRDSDRVAKRARKIIVEVDRLNGLANDLLDYSRGEIRLNMSTVVLDDFFSKFRQHIADRFAVQGIEIQTEITAREPVVMDEERMFRVFSNLAANARKAMPDGGIFAIKARESDRSLVFEVSDTGIGMSKEVQAKIFEPFFSSSESGGTGLGMSIVKSIIDAHEGSVSVKSKERVGTKFTLKLPKIS